ncbi:hypothetical protein L596_008309 [Steinernema carpocapsae]|uniref:Uncharacterized protein n=1 Tax=Steinernema carpocapsae TaxID=34508 RepID=A0A4U5PCC7_STECR|nr:hypothetical protein L596_008309 [Steinernema carpocapsae]
MIFPISGASPFIFELFTENTNHKPVQNRSKRAELNISDVILGGRIDVDWEFAEKIHADPNEARGARVRRRDSRRAAAGGDSSTFHASIFSPDDERLRLDSLIAGDLTVRRSCAVRPRRDVSVDGGGGHPDSVADSAEAARIRIPPLRSAPPPRHL